MPQTLILQSHPNYQLLCDQRTAWSKQNTHIILFELSATYINLFTLCATFGGNSVVGNFTFITALQICQAMITSFMNRDFCAKLQQISIPFLTQRVPANLNFKLRLLAVYCTQKRKTNASNVNVYIVPLYHILDSDRSYYLYETSWGLSHFFS